MKIIEWVFDTKIGKFLFVVIFSAIISGILCLIFDMSFTFLMLGATTVALFTAITNKNVKRWI
jgi:hypothetical protein